MFDVDSADVMLKLVKDVADSLVRSRSESLHTSRAVLRHKLEIRMVGGGQMFFIGL